jgi:transcriptional regulator with PAS, ATPase and Fis domain
VNAQIHSQGGAVPQLDDPKDYPGNVRELENLIERALILVEADRPLERGHLFQREKLPPAEGRNWPLDNG